MKMSDCEMQRIGKLMIYNVFWNAYPAGYLPCRRKGYRTKPAELFRSLHQEDQPLGDDQASSEFRLKTIYL
jgi:hypothetical protein